jgi:hypothetical protein
VGVVTGIGTEAWGAGGYDYTPILILEG